MRFSTKAIRVGQTPDKQRRAVINPIYQSATFQWEDLDHVPKIDYTRCANPNRHSLEEALASLENGKHCVVYSSGMAAIMGALSLLKAGDHLLMASDIYGGTQRVADSLLPRMGIEVTEYDGADPDSLDELVKPNSKMVIFESPTNPTLRVFDIAKTCRKAKELGLISVFDNTFASPYIQTPLDLGADISVHSTTKYIGGHSDVVGGALITNNDAYATAAFEYLKTVGSNPSPFDCWLSLRGLKTLSLRMKQHSENALKIARFLEKHPAVSKVHYPGLESHPNHALAKSQMRGFGGMVSFEVAGPVTNARTVAESVKVILLAESLGGVESLIAYPPLMSHATLTEEQRVEKGILPTLLRFSVGIEDADDLIEDLEQALAKVRVPEKAGVG